nr:hypothetical protein [Deltaproteobacteria bacterium]
MTKRLAMILAAAAMATPAVAAADDIEVKDETTTTTPPIVLPSTTTGPFKKGTLGISVAVPGAAPSYVVNFIYFLDDKAALDLIGGFTLARVPGDPTTVPPGDPATVFGFTAGLGYRMYKHVANNIHTYIEPYG